MKKFINFLLTVWFLLSMVSISALAAGNFSISGANTLETNQIINVTISANRDQAYNAVELSVSLNNFTYLGVSVAQGWTPVSGPALSGNTITFAGALLGSSATGAKAVLVVRLRAPNSPGVASISVSGNIDGTGLGTGSERANGSRNYTIKAPVIPTRASPTPTPKPLPGPVSITSTTHPDQNAWYQNKTATLSWTKTNDVNEFSYVLDKDASVQPDDTPDTQSTEKQFENLSDGVYYFKIKAKNSSGWGPVSQYTIRIDTTPPQPFTPTLVKTIDSDQAVLYFSTNDLENGNLTYYVTVDQNDLGVSSSGISIPADAKLIIVRAKDQAGNEYKATLDLSKTSDDISPLPFFGLNTPSCDKRIEEKVSTQTAVLTIASILLLIYAIVMTILYLKERGVIRIKKREMNE